MKHKPMATIDPTWERLSIISANVMHLPVPSGAKHASIIAQARRYVATELHDMGYSHRQIMGVLGLKSPQSITYYLATPPTNKKGE